MVNCPACLPPDNAGCAICDGSWSVSQEVANNFLQLEAKRIAVFQLATIIYEKISMAKTVEEIHAAIIEIIEQTQ